MTEQMKSALTIIRRKQVEARTGRSRSSTYADIKSGLFTSPILIGARAVGWPEREVDAVNAARIAGKTADEIRQLVARLEAARKTS
jgi:prophage regulatory protein